MTATGQTPPEQADLNALAALCQREFLAGRLAEAAEACRQILVIRPGIAEVHNNLGIILAQLGQHDSALAQFAQAIAIKPTYTEAYNNLGNVLLSQGKLDQAAARYEQALALRPDYAQAHYNLGNVLLKQEHFDLARQRFEHALALKPDYVEAYNNLGSVLMRQGELELARARFEQAIALKPDYAEAHNNLGIIFGQQGRIDQALARFQQALALQPDYAEARLGLSACYFIEGDYERAWPAFEARLQMPGSSPRPRWPRWTGEALAGRRLLLVAEEGLGDTLHFIRYARPLQELDAEIVLACPRALGRLLANHPHIDELFIPDAGELWPRCDYYIPLLSVPGVLRTTVTTIPAEIPYLAADAELSKAWRSEMAAIEGFKIGIVWQGSGGFLSDRSRSARLEQFAPLAGLPGVRLVSLQKGAGTEQIRQVDFPVLDLSDRLDEGAGPFMDTAAVIGGLDLVVSVDTAIGHLAGGLGAPVWLALELSPNWRWLRGRDDTPWYPTMRLFRQTSLGQWPEVFQRMAQAVQVHRFESG